MSRIGNRIIMIPEGVTVEENDGVITVKGPKGTLEKPLLRGVKYNVKDNEITLTIENEKDAAMHGTMNALLQNMIIGVTKGYSRGLEIVGVGYRFNVQGSKLIINAGYSHPVSLTIPEGANIIEEYALPLSLREVHTRHKDPKKVARQLKLVRESEYCDDYRFTLYVPKGSIADYLKEDFFRNWLKIKEDIY